MVARVETVAYLGLEARTVEVQCQIAPGMPGFHLVGLPDKAVNESRQRVQATLSTLGLALPPKRITINLSPADLPKEGSHYDLPIALALLAAMGVTDAEQLGDWVAVGELALDGRIVPSPGVLLAALHASGADKGLICPAAQGAEARWASGIPILAAHDLIALLNHLKGVQVLVPPEPGEVQEQARGPDLRQVKGQEVARRALEIAAAGGHNLFPLGTQDPSLLFAAFAGEIVRELDCRNIRSASPCGFVRIVGRKTTLPDRSGGASSEWHSTRDEPSALGRGSLSAGTRRARQANEGHALKLHGHPDAQGPA